MPALVAFGIFSLVAHWNDYFWPLIVINTPELATPPLGVAFFRSEEAGTDYGPLMAGDRDHHRAAGRSRSCLRSGASSRASRSPASRVDQTRQEGITMKRRIRLAGGIAAASWPAPAGAPRPTTDGQASSTRCPDLFKELRRADHGRVHEGQPGHRVNCLAPQPGLRGDRRGTLCAPRSPSTLPDVAFQGVNRQRVFVERGIAQPLDAFIARPTGLAKTYGFAEALLALGRFGGKQYGLGFAMSTPIIYYNADLVRKAGGDPDQFPNDWDGIFDLAAKIKALSGAPRLSIPGQITGNWMWQALVFSHGGTMLSADEKKVAFDGPAGKKAIACSGAW